MISYNWDNVYIGGVKLTPSNINDFNLNRVFESEVADIYSDKKPNSKGKLQQFILHVKDPSRYAENNSYLLNKGYHKRSPEVTWFDAGEEEPLEESINYIKQRL